MKIVTCPKCSGQVTIEEKDCGHRLVCPHCQKIMIPSESGAPVESPPAEASNDAERLEAVAAVIRTLSWVVLIIGAIFALAVLVGSPSGSAGVFVAEVFGPFLGIFLVMRFFARLAGIHAALLRLAK
jgi:hypothetical protein